MRAVVQDQYGGPETLKVEDVPPPRVGRKDVLVRVRAVSVNAADWHAMLGQPHLLRLAMGLFRPKPRVKGIDVAGVVESVGPDVTQFRAGDAVFGTGQKGALAELAAVREDRLAPKPARASFEEAAALPIAGLTALQALRDEAELAPGQRVVVYGAGGGVGTFTVQIAKAFGAHVTAVTSAAHLDLLRELGADTVIDYATEDPLARADRYDVFVDLAGNRTLDECRGALTPSGVLVLTGSGTRHGMGLLARPVSGVAARWKGQRIRVFVSHNDPDDLRVLARLVDEGKVKPAIERTYALHEAADAMRALGTGKVRGKLVVRVA